MKTKLTITLMLGLLTFAFVFLHPNTEENITPVSPPALQYSEFLIGGLHDAADVDFTYIKDSLNFNLWHSYVFSYTDTVSGKKYPFGWLGSGASNDSLFTPKERYVSGVQGVINNIASNNMKALLHRPKIEYLCYGQRSDYQCESTHLDTNYWFYSFNDHPVAGQYGSDYQDNTYGGGAWVRKCVGNPSNPESVAGFVVKRLKANTEQCHMDTSSEAYRWDSQSDWLIKPRIRIDSAFANNLANFNTLVCRIDAKNQKGNTFKSVDLKVRHFRPDQFTRYEGNYLEEYFFQQNDSNLTYTGDWGDWWGFSARGTRPLAQETDTTFNHADIQVYWYGNCDLWLDYVRVDNDVAHRLLKPGGDEQFEDWLQWEAQDIACHNSGASTINFYIELIEFNQLPCIKYVNERLNYYENCGKQFNVMLDLLTFYQLHLSWDDRDIIDRPEKIKDLYIDYTGAQEIFLGDPYPLIARRPQCTEIGKYVNSQIPSTLPKTTGDSILANIVSSPADYDAWLQGQLDTHCFFYKGGPWVGENHLIGVFMYLMKSGHEVSKLCDIPFIAMLQAHQWIGGGEVDREPTNEELNLMTNLAVSYGARGIIYWGGASFYTDQCNYNYAYWEPNVTPRYLNVYNQPKWESLKTMTGRLKTWGPTLMSFNNADRHSYIYRLERNDFISETYFYDIFTYKPYSGDPPCPDEDFPEGDTPPGGTVGECKGDRYLQAAVFKNPSQMFGLYFMIVNRRCSPYYEDGDNGGRRIIKLLFDANHSDMSGYNNWKITNVANENEYYTFNKTQWELINLSWFIPGEGRLFKLEPNE